MSDTQQEVANLSQEKLAEIAAVVIKAFKPLINAKSVNSDSVAVNLFEIGSDTDDSEVVTASVILKSHIDKIDGFDPTYVEGILHIDYSGCYINEETNTFEWKTDDFSVGLNYAFYSYNMTWGVKNPDGTLEHDNGEVFGIVSQDDDAMSFEVMGTIMGLPNTDTEYRDFLQAVFDIASKAYKDGANK